MLVNNLDETLTYTPTANYFGSDCFQYTVRDNSGLVSNVAQVDITVTPVSEGPLIPGTSGDDIFEISPTATDGQVEVKLNGTSLGVFDSTGGLRIGGGDGVDRMVVNGNNVANSFELHADRIVLNGNSFFDELIEHREVFAKGSWDTITTFDGADILIGGTGIYVDESTNTIQQAALDAIMAEWRRPDINYNARIAHLNVEATLGNGTMFFNGWISLGRTAIICLLAYGALVAVLRISGKRTLAKMNAFDLVVTVALGSTLSAVCMFKDVALAEGVATMALLIFCQFAVAWGSVRLGRVRRLVRAEPTLLVYRGEFLVSALRSQRVTESEVRQATRSQAVADLDAAVVVLETDGSFSVLQPAEKWSHEALADIPALGV
jgi:uncharacterized membrane protein YcaP (DUF421 family)